eukprot:48527-Rhodomonas_salina.1
MEMSDQSRVGSPFVQLAGPRREVQACRDRDCIEPGRGVVVLDPARPAEQVDAVSQLFAGSRGSAVVDGSSSPNWRRRRQAECCSDWVVRHVRPRPLQISCDRVPASVREAVFEGLQHSVQLIQSESGMDSPPITGDQPKLAWSKNPLPD